ncbi:MAG: hypothetical protein DMF75_02455 [Acidobacteria bacterium]|nr:MAG: hypothetical protein DMF75_02455 [Acidobacteriota bacterium]
MRIATTEYLDAIAHLPNGAALRADDVPWEQYEELLAKLYAVRVFYDGGRMEFIAPTFHHERAAAILKTLAFALCDELDLDLECLGSSTFRSQWKAKGAEPDDERDPPPDIVVETELTSASLDKFPIYAALGVPEIWRERKKVVRFYVLGGASYVEVPNSRAFPFLDSVSLSEFLMIGLAEGSRKAARAFRGWVREHHPAT